MLDTLITSKTRVKLLLKFFLNNATISYLRNLEVEFKEGSNSIRLELNKFEKAGLLLSEEAGNKKMFRANVNHPMYGDLNNLVKKYVGLDQVIDRIARTTGNLQEVYLTGKLAKGLDARLIELIIVGHNIDTRYLTDLCKKVEKLIGRKITFNIFLPSEFALYKNSTDRELFLIYN